MKKLFPFIYLNIILLSNPFHSKGQSAFIPQRLSNDVNSEYIEINPVLSPDGKTLYFSRVNDPRNTFGIDNSQDIWYSQLQKDGTWSTAQHMPFPFNTARNNAILSISSDGNTFLINGIFSSKKVQWIKRGLSVITKNSDGSLGLPKRLHVPSYSRKNEGSFSNAFLSADGGTLFLAFTQKWKGAKLNLYVCHKIGKTKFTKPKKIKSIKEYGETFESPFLSSDKNYLFFATKRPNGGSLDIMKVKKTDGTYRNWEQPVVLTDTINSLSWDSYFKTNQKGSWAYFSSEREGSAKADIYKVKIFEENPYLVLSGKVLNTINNQPFDPKKKFVVESDGVIIDSAIINPDSSSYEVKLKLGKKYNLKAVSDKYISISKEIDASNIKDYTERTLDLELQPLSYVLVSGRIINKSTNLSLPASDLDGITIMGMYSDSLKFDSTNSSYKLKMPHGSAYALMAEAKNYESIPIKVDLTNVNEYQEISADLFVEEKSASATITGKIYNKKTNKLISPRVNYTVVVNDSLKVDVQINKDASEYTLKLPVRKSYFIQAKANKYFSFDELLDLNNVNPNNKVIKDLHLSPLEIGSSVKLNNVFFETGKAILKPESFVELNKVYDFLNDYPEVVIEIAGHTDNVGAADKNLLLSQQRAEAVTKYLLEKGIPVDRISSKGYGMTRPVVPNNSNANKAKNRRVEFTILDL